MGNREGIWCVNNKRVNSYEEAQKRAFGGRYARAIRALYQELSVPLS